MRECHWCGANVPDKEFCPDCLAAFPTRPKPEEMTADERQAEMELLRYAEVPFDLIHGRIEQLVGRPVWTHELGLNWGGVCREARWEDRPATMKEIISLIPPEKRLIVVVDPAAEVGG